MYTNGQTLKIYSHFLTHSSQNSSSLWTCSTLLFVSLSGQVNTQKSQCCTSKTNNCDNRHGNGQNAANHPAESDKTVSTQSCLLDTPCMVTVWIFNSIVPLPQQSIIPSGEAPINGQFRFVNKPFFLKVW